MTSRSPMFVADSRDEQILSPYACYIRSNCIEYFTASTDEHGRGRQTPVSEGRVGIRCVFCKDESKNKQASQASSFPNKISSIPTSLAMIQTRHFPICQFIPKNVRTIMEKKNVRNKDGGIGSSPKKKGFSQNQYFEECARDKGLVDTDGGIRFVLPPPNDGENDTSELAAATDASTNANDIIIGRNVFAVSAAAKKDNVTDDDGMTASADAATSNDVTTYSEIEMLERTRHELLNGRDFWICTTCAVGVSSLTQPCGKCHNLITFVPLEVEEFEEFVQKQRAMKRRAVMMMMKEDEEEESSSEESEDSDEEFLRLQRARKQSKKKSRAKVKKESKPKKKRTVAPKLEAGPITYKTLDPNMPLVSEGDKSMVTPYVFQTMQQMRPCNYFENSSERNGSRKYVENGFPGVECRHCAHLDKPRRFFYKTAEKYSSNWQHIPEHLMKCQGCPEDIKRKLKKKKTWHERQRSDLPKGSQREFFDMIWAKLYED